MGSATGFADLSIVQRYNPFIVLFVPDRRIDRFPELDVLGDSVLISHMLQIPPNLFLTRKRFAPVWVQLKRITESKIRLISSLLEIMSKLQAATGM